MEIEKVEKRVIVVDTEENEKYVLPGNYDAAFLMGGTIERVRQKLIKNNGKPVEKAKKSGGRFQPHSPILGTQDKSIGYAESKENAMVCRQILAAQFGF